MTNQLNLSTENLRLFRRYDLGKSQKKKKLKLVAIDIQTHILLQFWNNFIGINVYVDHYSKWHQNIKSMQDTTMHICLNCKYI